MVINSEYYIAHEGLNITAYSGLVCSPKELTYDRRPGVAHMYIESEALVWGGVHSWN